MSKNKSHKIETQALNLACSYLDKKIGCPKNKGLYNCNNECEHNNNLYGDECWRTYLRIVAKDDINEDDKIKKKEIILNDLQIKN